MSKEVTLPSGRTLTIGLPDFSDAKSVFRIVCEELRPIKINPDDDVANLYKDFFCSGMASQKLEAAVMACAKKSTIDKERVSIDLFSEEDHRQDWLPVMLAVGRSAIDPFMKSLLQEFGPILAQLAQELASKSKTMTSSPSTASSAPATAV